MYATTLPASPDQTLVGDMKQIVVCMTKHSPQGQGIGVSLSILLRDHGNQDGADRNTNRVCLRTTLIIGLRRMMNIRRKSLVNSTGLIRRNRSLWP